MPRILIIEDDDVLAALLLEKLGEKGYQAISVGNGNQALAALAGQSFDLVITDILLPEKDGLETIGEIKQRNPTLPIIAMSGGGIVNAGYYLDMARRVGATETLAKPFVTAELLVIVRELLPKEADGPQ